MVVVLTKMFKIQSCYGSSFNKFFHQVKKRMVLIQIFTSTKFIFTMSLKIKDFSLCIYETVLYMTLLT